MTTLGLNVLAQTVADRDRLYGWIARLKSRAIVIMDDIDMARALARQNRRLLVIHRGYRENDQRLHLDISPEAWVRSVLADGREGVVVQCLNEPSGYDDVDLLARWCAEAMRLASWQGIRLALPNFAVGHPDEAAVRRGAFDPLVRAFGKWRGHVLGVHEYFQQNAVQEPYLVGRVGTLAARFDLLRVERPIIVATEAGRDVGGGERDGWRDTGWSQADYARRLAVMADRQARAGVYAACVFGYGRGGGGNWRSFDIEGAETVLKGMADYNAGLMSQAQSARVRSFVRVRQLPSVYSPIVMTLAPGRAISFDRVQAVRREGWTWLPLIEGGWVAAEAAGVKGGG